MKQEIINYLQKYEPNFKWNEKLRSIYKDVYEGIGSGIMLFGAVGSGKSLLMRSMETHGNFTMVTIPELIYEYSAGGFERVNKYLYNETKNEYGILNREPLSICIDDLGSESKTLQFFGTKATDVIDMLLYIRYEIYKRYGLNTHVTTNLMPADFEKIYGARIYSRIKEMNKILKMPSNDYRIRKE